MANVIDASALTLAEVIDCLQLQIYFESDFRPYVTPEPLTEDETARVAALRKNWQRYYLQGKIADNQATALESVFQIAGYSADPALQVTVEVGSADLTLGDSSDAEIRGRTDLWVGQSAAGDRLSLCAIVVEAKNGAIHPVMGLPQLTAYAGAWLEKQDVVWGLVTNGLEYLFVRLEAGIYRQFRSLSILMPNEAEQLLAVAIAIRHGA